MNKSKKTESPHIDEPVAWAAYWPNGAMRIWEKKPEGPEWHKNQFKPLYAAPQTKMTDLTDDEIKNATLESVNFLLDHIDEYGTASEGVMRAVYFVARAAIEAHEEKKGQP